MPDPIVLAPLPLHYDTAAVLTLAIPLAVLVVLLGWWIWAVKVRAWNRRLP